MIADSRRVGGVPCWLLHRRPYRQSSAIWELLCDNGERLAVVARAVRASSRRSASAPGLCSRLRAWYRGRGELFSLTRYEIEVATSLRGRALLYALAANELLVRCTRRGDSHAALPKLYASLLSGLATSCSEPEREALYTCFQLNVLAVVGYGPELSTDSSGRPLQMNENYRFDEDFRLQRLRLGQPGWSGAALEQVRNRNLVGQLALATARELVDRLLRVATGRAVQSGKLLAPPTAVPDKRL